jgi:transposase
MRNAQQPSQNGMLNVTWSRDKIKMLYWERTGFVLWYKRLEKNRFAWPLSSDEEVVTLSGRELNWLLDGIDVFAMQPHEEVSFETVL